jgi:hypothetical protein
LLFFSESNCFLEGLGSLAGGAMELSPQAMVAKRAMAAARGIGGAVPGAAPPQKESFTLKFADTTIAEKDAPTILELKMETLTPKEQTLYLAKKEEADKGKPSKEERSAKRKEAEEKRKKAEEARKQGSSGDNPSKAGPFEKKEETGEKKTEEGRESEEKVENPEVGTDENITRKVNDLNKWREDFAKRDSSEKGKNRILVSFSFRGTNYLHLAPYEELSKVTDCLRAFQSTIGKRVQSFFGANTDQILLANAVDNMISQAVLDEKQCILIHRDPRGHDHLTVTTSMEKKEQAQKKEKRAGESTAERESIEASRFEEKIDAETLTIFIRLLLEGNNRDFYTKEVAK